MNKIGEPVKWLLTMFTVIAVVVMLKTDGAYKGIMTIKTGLAASRNTTALQTFQAIPNKKINEFVTGLNLHPEYDVNNYIHEAHSIGAYTGKAHLI